MQVDQASWHISDKLNIPENYFYNEVFDSLERVIDTLCEGLNSFNSVPEQLKSMTYFLY